MKAGEKVAPEQNSVVQPEPFRAPASVEEAYELGWQWQRESFVGLGEFGTTKEGVTKRVGLAYFVSGPATDGIVIPFVATFEFGQPRRPSQPYIGGSVCEIDDEARAMAPEKRSAMDAWARPSVRSDVATALRTKLPPHEEAEKEKLWRVRQLMRGRVIHTYTSPIAMTEEEAVSDAFEAYTEELHLDVSKVKVKTPCVRRRTKKAKTRR
jgi:hypothetical protein